MESNSFDKIFEVYKTNYDSILGTQLFYPAKNGTGFTERNLSVNFSKAYQQLHPSAISWFEFQFGEDNNLHYDGLIIDPAQKKIFLLESKRFKSKGKITEVEEDVKRILAAKDIYKNDFDIRIKDFREYQLYGVVLADVWTLSNGRECYSKKKIKESFERRCFIDEYFSNQSLVVELNNKGVTYYVQHIKVRDAAGYYLTSFIWKV